MDVKQELEELAERIHEDAQKFGEFAAQSANLSRKDKDSFPGFDDLIPPEAPDEIQQARRSLLESSWKLQWLCAGSGHLLEQHRIYYQQLACLRWLVHFKVLNHIPLIENGAPWETVASSAGVPISQLKSVALMMATNRFLRVVSPERVAHSRLSAEFLQRPEYSSTVEFVARYSAPIALALTDATNRWGETTAKNETAFNIAFNTDTPWFDYIANSSEMSALFAEYMLGRNTAAGLALDYVTKGFDWDQLGEANVVDVGGSTGQTCILLLKKYPSLHCTVQDLPSTITEASNIRSTLDSEISSRLSFTPHDFFKPQPPEIAARTDIYFLRRILHDWPDTEAGIILQHLATALSKPAARILIMDVVLPVPGTEAPLYEATLRATDLTMAQHLNAREREMEDWIRLFESTTPKLRLRGYKLPAGSSMAIMELGRADERD